jgi:hypothetical protein
VVASVPDTFTHKAASAQGWPAATDFSAITQLALMPAALQPAASRAGWPL